MLKILRDIYERISYKLNIMATDFCAGYGCRYCRSKDKHTIRPSFQDDLFSEYTMQIERGQVNISKDGKFMVSFDIDRCPFCGREL